MAFGFDVTYWRCVETFKIMRNSIIRNVAIIITAFVLIIFFLSLTREPVYNTESLTGNKITKFQIESLNNDELISYKEISKKKYALINFWASWCAPCRLEHEKLIELSKNRDLTIFGVNFKDKKNNAIKYLDEMGNPYTYLLKDPDGKQSVKFGIYGIPESILVDRNLIIKKKVIGPLTDLDIKEISDLIMDNK